MNEDFKIVERKHGPCWQYENPKFWIVYYSHLEEIGKNPYCVYEAMYSFEGTDPWCVNNMKIASTKSLEDAFEFVRKIMPIYNEQAIQFVMNFYVIDRDTALKYYIDEVISYQNLLNKGVKLNGNSLLP